jgi:MoxR-like ATPase
MNHQKLNSPGTSDQNVTYKPKHFNLPKAGVLVKRGDIEPYVFTDKIAIAVDVAFSTKRPLLVSGDPGCGKSRLAEALAAQMGWHFLGKTITSRTTLEDLTHNYDHLKRLHDAHSAGADSSAMPEDWSYNRPGIFWYAFNYLSAQRKGGEKYKSDNGSSEKAEMTHRKQDKNRNDMVILIDEIDKAEPDLPNDLLDLLEHRRIELIDGKMIQPDCDTKTFTVITSNQERTLPKAFIRRCVCLKIDDPDVEMLMKIAESHLGAAVKNETVEKIAEQTIALRDQQNSRHHKPGTSEFIDTLKAYLDLKITPNDPEWAQVEATILKKSS